MKDDTLWKHFSKFIRLRDSDENGICQCFTCPTRLEWNSGGMQAGHFISRRHWATRYHEKNVHAQCVNCNHFQSGRQYEYGLSLDKKYGAGTAEYLLAQSRQVEKFSTQTIKSLSDHYRHEVERLLKEKHLK